MVGPLCSSLLKRAVWGQPSQITVKYVLGLTRELLGITRNYLEFYLLGNLLDNYLETNRELTWELTRVSTARITRNYLELTRDHSGTTVSRSPSGVMQYLLHTTWNATNYSFWE